MKKFTLKTLLVAVALCVGSSSAWAEAGDVTTNANIDFSNAITDGVVTGTVNSMTIGASSYIDTDNWLRNVDGTSTVTIPEEQRAQSKDVVTISFKMGWGNKQDMGSGFRLKDSNGEYIATFQMARWDGKGNNANSLNIDMAGLYGAAASNAPIKARYTKFTISVDYAARTITSVVFCSNTDGKGTTKESTFVSSLTNTNPIATFECYGFGVGSNTDRADAIDELLIQTTEGDYSVVTYDYTVNWKCGDDIVKSAIRQGEKNATISLFDTDKTAFTENAQKYFYVSDDVEGKTVADDGSTVVTVTVREAENWNYTVNAVDEGNNILGVITTGTVVEGNDLYYYYPTFYLNGTDLLRADINDKSYGRGATPDADNAVYNVIYKKKGISNTVFYQECENIEGLTAVSAGNVPVRCSNGKGAMATTETTIATLAPGKYTISGFAWGNSGTVFTLTANETAVATLTTASSTVNISTSEEFTLTSTTDIVLGAQGNAGSSPKVIDFIYIQKTGDVITKTSTAELEGYKTFYNATKNFQVDANTTIYKAAAPENGYVTITAVEGDIIPANTPVFLKTSDKESYTITLTETAAESTGDFAGNVLKAATEAGAIDGAYILAYTTANGLGIYPFTGSLDAGDVYLTATGQAKLRFGIADDATAIKNVSVEAADNAAIYNVAGQRVNATYKGIVIKNGKKYLNK